MTSLPRGGVLTKMTQKITHFFMKPLAAYAYNKIIIMKTKSNEMNSRIDTQKRGADLGWR